MKRLTTVLIPLIIISLLFCIVGCGGDEEETPATATSTPTGVETVTWKMGLTRGLEIFPGTAYQMFADLTQEYTDGRVRIDLYPHSTLFPSETMWEATITGAMDVFSQTGYYVTSVFPNMWVWFAIQGLFESREHCRACLEDGRLVQMMATGLEQEFPVKVLGLFPFGVQVAFITKDTEVTTLDDLQGLRTNSYPGQPPGPVHDYAGLVGAPVSMEEVYTSFLTGVIDTVSLPVTSMREARLYEVGNHMYVYPGGCYVVLCAINRDAWESLPSDIQDIIENRVWPEVYEWTLDEMEAYEDAELDFLQENMATVHEMTQEEYATFWEEIKDHPIHKMMFVAIDPEVIDIVEELRPSNQ